MPGTATVKVVVPGSHHMVALLGERDQFLRQIEAAFSTTIHVRGNEVTIVGPEDETGRAAALFEEMVLLLQRGHVLDGAAMARSIAMMKSDGPRPSEVLDAAVFAAGKGRVVRPKTVGQKRYADAIASRTVTFAIGPAGTGKSYLAVAQAVKDLRERNVARIILTRPAVEAGEKLGFLPGDLLAKVDPYLRPLYDALYDLLDIENVQRLMERNVVEVVPLAYMRGRTLNDAFIIVDEAQNTTPAQMKMVLTRLGFGSRMVVNGDVTQIDLPEGQRSGLLTASRILDGVEGIAFIELGAADVVRHPLVQQIVEAYERADRPGGLGGQSQAKRARTSQSRKGTGSRSPRPRSIVRSTREPKVGR